LRETLHTPIISISNVMLCDLNALRTAWNCDGERRGVNTPASPEEGWLQTHLGVLGVIQRCSGTLKEVFRPNRWRWLAGRMGAGRFCKLLCSRNELLALLDERRRLREVTCLRL